MARSSRRRGRSKGVSVNFKGVEGKLAAIKDGEYAAKVVEVTKEEGQAAEYLKWTFELTDDEVAGRKVFLNTSLAPQALWNLRGLLEAIGIEVPDDEMDLELDEYVGLPIGLLIENETYEGKKRPRVSDYFAADGESNEGAKSEDDEEEEDEKPRRSRRASRDDDEDDEEEEKPRRSRRRNRDGEDDEDEEEEKPKRSRRSRARDEDEDEDEEEEKPRGRKSKKKAKGPTEDDINDMSEDELEELVEEHELDVDLQASRTLTKKRNLVIDALTEAGVL